MERIIKEYLDWKGTYAFRASINYKIWLNRFVEICGSKPLDKYDVSDLVKYRNWLEGHFSPCTISFATVVMKNFFQFCRTQNYSCLSPTLIRLPRMEPKSHRAITEEEFNITMSVMPSGDFRSLRDQVIIRMLWDTGVRVSELCDLDLSQIDEKKRSAVIQTKKTGKKRIIVWSEETHRYLMKYMTKRLKLCNSFALLIGLKKNREWSQRLSPKSVQRTIKYFVDRAGIKVKITPHSFRHGWAHKRRDNNASLAFIQRGLGHINPVSTFIYEQYNDTEFEKYANSYLKTA